jgi:hypothetical protein
VFYREKAMYKTGVCRVVFVCMVCALAVHAQSPPFIARGPATPLYVKVQFNKNIRLKSLRPGEITQGNLASDVYASDRKLFSAGSAVRLTVDHVDRKPRFASERWPWVIKAFLPRHEAFPVFKDVAIAAPSGAESRIDVSLLSAAPKMEIHAAQRRGRKKGMDSAEAESAIQAGGIPHPSSRSIGMVMSFEARPSGDTLSGPGSDQPSISAPGSLPAGTRCRILLLSGISASKSHPGDKLQARVLEPVLADSRVLLPAGSMFEGTVTKAIAPRMLSRPGSLSVVFTSVSIPGGPPIAVAASLSQVELNRGSHTKIDAEGHLRGDRPGAASLLINGGLTAGIAKEVDDGTQLVMEAILSGATDASTAGTARIAGTVASGIFMLTRHGRDVVLPSYTEMSLTLNRPLTLSSP